MMYRRGKGVRRNSAEAVKWYRKAAEQGDADAQDMLNHYYKCAA
jgi:TPR repeat protein